MDLHFSSAVPTGEEQVHIDGFVTEACESVPPGRSGNTERRSLLLPLLHSVQKQFGFISPGALNGLSASLGVPPADAYGVASFYSLFCFESQPPITLHVCDDIACLTRGADGLCRALVACEPAIKGTIAVKRSPCLGLCERAPAVLAIPTGITNPDYTIAPATVESVVKSLADLESVRRTPPGSTPQSDTGDLRILGLISRHNGTDLQYYVDHGGFQALKFARAIGSDTIIEKVKQAGLTGRGGAAFPTAIKWRSVASEAALPHYVVCNADESEPGTFKDRVLMEQAPFAVVEALAVAGAACNAEKGYIYIRGEYPEAEQLLRQAILQAERFGWIGDTPLGQATPFHIEVRRGAGAYICGEETALLNSIEGFRGEPRSKPPFPSQVGLFGKPTAINNVETLVNILPILQSSENGAEPSAEARLFCVCGRVTKPGVYELENGMTARQLLELAGGVLDGGELRAVLLGGAAGSFIRPDELDLVLTNEAARAAGVSLGSGVFMVFDETVNMVEIVRRIAAFFRDESCGQCVPCRVGTVRQEESMARLKAGGKPQVELKILRELDQVMKDASICGLGHTASSALISAIDRLGLFAAKGIGSDNE